MYTASDHSDWSVDHTEELKELMDEIIKTPTYGATIITSPHIPGGRAYIIDDPHIGFTPTHRHALDARELSEIAGFLTRYTFNLPLPSPYYQVAIDEFVDNTLGWGVWAAYAIMYVVTTILVLWFLGG